MPTAQIKLGKYTNGKGTLEGQVKKNLVEWALQAQSDIQAHQMDRKILNQELHESKIKNTAILKMNKTYRENQKWLDSLDIGDFESVEDYFMNLKAKENGLDILTGKDYKALEEEHEKLKSLYMKMILN
jgi:hypothetical protein